MIPSTCYRRVVTSRFKEHTCYRGVVTCNSNNLHVTERKTARIRMKFKVNHKHAVRMRIKLKYMLVCLPKAFDYLKDVVNCGVR